MADKKHPPQTATPTPTPATPPPAAPGAPETPVPVENISVPVLQFEDLKTQAAKSQEHWNRYVRAVADLDNYRKRAVRERQEAVKFANEALLQKLLSVLDHFEMAQNAAQNGQAETLQSLHAGIAMIQQQLKNILTEAGLEEVDALGKTFDPHLHEALSQQESTDVPEGQVLQQLRKGYKLRERLLRPASVIVARKPATPPPA